MLSDTLLPSPTITRVSPFDVVTGDYTTSDFVTATFTVDGPLEPNVNDDLRTFNSLPVLSFSFSDGHHTVDQTNAVYEAFDPYTTDAEGNLAGFQLYAFSTVGGIGFGNVYTEVEGPTGPTNLYSAGNTGLSEGRSYQIGTLAVGAPASITPEPSSFALLCTGLLGMAGIVRKRSA